MGLESYPMMSHLGPTRLTLPRHIRALCRFAGVKRQLFPRGARGGAHLCWYKESGRRRPFGGSAHRSCPPLGAPPSVDGQTPCCLPRAPPNCANGSTAQAVINPDKGKTLAVSGPDRTVRLRTVGPPRKTDPNRPLLSRRPANSCDPSTHHGMLRGPHCGHHEKLCAVHPAFFLADRVCAVSRVAAAEACC